MTPRFGPDFTPSTVMYFCPASLPRALSSLSTSPSISKTFSILRAQHLPTWKASGSGRASENSSLGTVLAGIHLTSTRQIPASLRLHARIRTSTFPPLFRPCLRSFDIHLHPRRQRFSLSPCPSLRSSPQIRSLRRPCFPFFQRLRLRPRARTPSLNLSPSPLQLLRLRRPCSLRPRLCPRVLPLTSSRISSPMSFHRYLRLPRQTRPRALPLSPSPSLYPI